MVQIEEVDAEKPVGEKRETSGLEKYDELMQNMQKTKDKWDEEDGVEDEQDAILSQAIELAIEQGRGWAPGEKEAYLEKILDDDFIPPLFCSTNEELEKTGLQDAFSSLVYDGEVSSFSSVLCSNIIRGKAFLLTLYCNRVPQV